MRQRKPVSLAAACLLGTFATAAALAQTPPKENGASMVKPPDVAGAANPANPDHMPVKRPPKSVQDKMMHAPPASAAAAK
ncbi:MAG: hypothetical protein RXR20_34315 [Paraburkholderia sp.]|jgi:hypothetical protein|uniref:hypothetical protein n=1 Tax=Burkholderiaceae TaxID=119060 RepID=UPI0010F6F1FB|nr:hypothetical protein [Burkholderia sp. 4M9327F10]